MTTRRNEEYIEEMKKAALHPIRRKAWGEEGAMFALENAERDLRALRMLLEKDAPLTGDEKDRARVLTTSASCSLWMIHDKIVDPYIIMD